MSKTKLKPTWYAMYRGDTFIDLGTADYLAEKYHKKKQSLLYLSKPAYHRNAPKNSKRLTLYKMEDQAMKETKEESPLMKKLSDILADKNDDYYITAAGSTISIYYCKCKLFEVVLDEINNPRFLFDGMLTFCGAFKMLIDIDDEEDLTKDWEFGASSDYMPVSDEYRNWLNDPILGNIRSVALMIAVIYGQIGELDGRDRRKLAK